MTNNSIYKILDLNEIQTTYSYFNFAKPTPDQIDVVDIAHSLALICRYGGHIKQFYSVAAHSCLCHDMAVKDGHRDVAIYMLIHDFHEALVGDITRPVKIYMKEKFGFDFNSEICDPIDAAMYEKFKLTPPNINLELLIKYYDNKALFTEKDSLFYTHYDWGWTWDKLTPEEFAPYMDNTKDWKAELLYRFNIYQ